MRLWKECTILEKSWLVFLAISYLLLLTWNKMDGLSFAIACSGILCIFFAAKAKIETFYIGIIYNSLYAYYCYTVNDDLILYLHLLFHLPLQLLGIHLWRKSPIGHPTLQENILVREMFPRAWIAVVLGLVFITFFTKHLIYSLSLSSLFPNLIFLSFIFSIIANILMSCRFKECWIAWISVNVFNIAYWAYLAIGTQPNYVVAFMIGTFLVQCTYGFFSWYKIHHLQNEMFLGPYCALQPSSDIKKRSFFQTKQIPKRG